MSVPIRRNRILTSLLLGALVAVPWTAAGAGAAAASTSRMFVVAHRGDSSDNPESTLAAFGSAISKGADGIEFDVRFTSDEVPVALHDDTLDRTTTCTGPVNAMTYSVIEHCDAGVRYSPTFRGAHVPTVAESLEYIRTNSSDVRAFLHIKTVLTPAQARQIIGEVADHGMSDRVQYILENETNESTLEAADVPLARLGRMVHQVTDWLLDYPVLVPYADNYLVVSPLFVRTAVRQGKLVLPVEGNPASLDEIIAAGANGVYLNKLSAGLRTLAADHLH